MKMHKESSHNRSDMIFNEERKLLLANAIEKSSHPFLVGCTGGQIKLVNNAFCQLTGYCEEELQSKRWDIDLTPPEWHHKARVLKEINTSQKPLRYKKEYLCKDDSRVPVEVFIHPFIDENGQIPYYYGFVTDLTSRNQALELLHKSEAQMLEISENMLDMIKKVDTHGIIEYASPSHKNCGWDPANLVGNSIFKFIHQEDRDRVRTYFNTLLSNASSGRVEYRYKHVEGHYLYMETTGNWLFNENGISGMIMVSRDITERKQAEIALAQSEEKFSKIFLNNPDPITISTISGGRYLEVNNAYYELTGYDPHDVIGQTGLHLGVWSDIEEREAFLTTIREQGSVRGIEKEFKSKTGEVITTLLSADIIDVEGEPHLLSIIKDITERKKVDEALRLSEECFSKAFNASLISMTIATLEDGIFIDVNDSFCRACGYSREEMLGRTSLELQIWADEGDRYRVKQMILDKGSVRYLETRYRKRTGEIRLCLYSGEKIDIDGQACILSIFLDITERKQMELEMTRLDRLNMVGQIAASIGHEIRNPMTTVRGYLQILNNKKNYGEDKEVLDLMIEEIDRANGIITEFLSLARDKLIQLVPANLNSIVSSLFPLIQADATAQDKNIEVRLEKVPDVLLDEKEIRQLMLNLVRNGLEAMSPGGTLTIRTFATSDEVVLYIQDQGQGIEDEVIEKIGTPFFTTKEDGTGLGMAVCFGIAKRHNAKIDIESSSIGTVIYIRFPL